VLEQLLHQAPKTIIAVACCGKESWSLINGQVARGQKDRFGAVVAAGGHGSTVRASSDRNQAWA